MQIQTDKAIRSKQKNHKNTWAYLKENYDLYLFLLPAIIIIFVFSYVPLYGIQIAFKDYSASAGIWGSKWVGLTHFKRFFDSATAWRTIWNTLSLSIYSLVVGFPIPIILALFLNAMNKPRYRKVIQTITYAPNFISTVVVGGMIILFLSPRVGIVNNMMAALGFDKINFMAKSGMFQSIYVWSGIWQSAGWSSIIYFAALSSVSPELHEAAVLDGATRLQRIWHIDFPGILPTTVILLIMSVGSLLSVGFEKAYLLQNDQNMLRSEIISTYVYKMGMLKNDMSFSSAVDLLNSAVNCILLITVNYISGKVSDNSLW